MRIAFMVNFNVSIIKCSVVACLIDFNMILPNFDEKHEVWSYYDKHGTLWLLIRIVILLFSKWVLSYLKTISMFKLYLYLQNFSE